MSGNEEWGEWQLHDGKGCPCRGAMVQSEERQGLIETHIAEGIWKIGDQVIGTYRPGLPSAWVWGQGLREYDIIRYRIHRPKGMAILEQLLADIPAPVAPEVVG